MKIIYLHQYFSTLRGKEGTRSFEMARRLVKMGHEVHMITSWRDNTDVRDWFKTIEEGIVVHWYPNRYQNDFTTISRIIAFLKFSFAAFLKGRSLSGDVVFATSTPLTIIIPGFLIARKLSIPLVFEVRDLWPSLPIAMGVIKDPISKFLARMLEKFAYRSSAKIVALSDDMRAGILKLGYPAENISVIPNSCDLDFFQVNEEAKTRNRFREQHNIPLRSKVIIYAGTFGKINGVDYLVELASELISNKDIFFFAVGQGAEFSKVKKLAEKSGVLGKNFRMLNGLSKSEMPKLFCASDFVSSLFIPLPEMEANSANKFFDGLSSGRCILINYGGWQEKLLLDNRAGIRLSTNSTNAAHQIVQLCQDEILVKSYGQNSRAMGEKLFSRDNLAIKLEKVLKSVLERPNL